MRSSFHNSNARDRASVDVIDRVSYRIGPGGDGGKTRNAAIHTRTRKGRRGSAGYPVRGLYGNGRVLEAVGQAVPSAANCLQLDLLARSLQETVGGKGLLAGDDKLAGAVHRLSIHRGDFIGAIACLVELATSDDNERNL